MLIKIIREQQYVVAFATAEKTSQVGRGAVIGSSSVTTELDTDRACNDSDGRYAAAWRPVCHPQSSTLLALTDLNVANVIAQWRHAAI